METSKKRRLTSRGLLATFVIALLLASVHVHRAVMPLGVECIDCATHAPHSGHLSDGAPDLHSCVLCQLLSVPFVSATVCGVLPLRRTSDRLRFYSPARIANAATGTQSSRAPPRAR